MDAGGGGRLGKFGRGGIDGSFILGIELPNWPKRGLGGGSKFGVMPPFARGIYGGAEGVFENLSLVIANGAGGL